jgi:hypothetical protein
MHSNSFDAPDGSADSPAFSIFQRPGTGFYFDPVDSTFVFVVNGKQVAKLGAKEVEPTPQAAPAMPVAPKPADHLASGQSNRANPAPRQGAKEPMNGEAE